MTPIKSLMIVAALLAAFVASGWRTAAQRDEEVRQELKWAARDSFNLEQRVNDLDARVKALEAR